MGGRLLQLPIVTMEMLHTVYSDHEWDLVLENPSDRENVKDTQWSVDSILNTALVNFAESTTKRQALHVLLSNLSVDYITTDQNSAGWFLLRSFAITSSAADSIFDELYEEACCRRLADPLFSYSRRIFCYYSINENTDLECNQDDSVGADDGSEVEDVQAEDEEPEDGEYAFSINDVARNVASWTRGGTTDSMVEALESDGVLIPSRLLMDYVTGSTIQTEQ